MNRDEMERSIVVDFGIIVGSFVMSILLVHNDLDAEYLPGMR
jgi:hypothetical protein